MYIIDFPWFNNLNSVRVVAQPLPASLSFLISVCDSYCSKWGIIGNDRVLFKIAWVSHCLCLWNTLWSFSFLRHSCYSACCLSLQQSGQNMYHIMINRGLISVIYWTLSFCEKNIKHRTLMLLLYHSLLPAATNIFLVRVLSNDFKKNFNACSYHKLKNFKIHCANPWECH